MKTAQGYYLNIYSEIGYGNNGIKEDIDIFIIFPEYMSERQCNFDCVEEIAQEKVKEFASSKEYGVNMDRSELTYKIKTILLDPLFKYEIQVMVN